MRRFPSELVVLSHRITDSLEIIQNMLRLSQHPYIALSFGKDSLAMMDLVYGVKPGVKCLFLKSEESFLMYDYERLISWYTEHLGLNLHIVDTHRLSEYAFDWERARKAGNRDFYLDDFFEGWDGVFMGLRIEESKRRRQTLTAKRNNEVGRFIMRYAGGRRKGMVRCCPMACWKASEILFYLKACNLPMLDVYQEGEHIRTTARITGDAQRQNALFWIKKSKPENWNRIVRMLPELRNL